MEEFELDIVDLSVGLPIVIGVPGWFNDSQDNAWKVWDTALCQVSTHLAQTRICVDSSSQMN